MTEINKMANDHWNYSCEIMKLMYIRAFEHGYKHGYDDAKGDGE